MTNKKLAGSIKNATNGNAIVIQRWVRAQLSAPKLVRTMLSCLQPPLALATALRTLQHRLRE